VPSPAARRRRGEAATAEASRDERPLVVYGPWSLRYDFGPGHPLTPRRFGPGISLLETLGASRFLEPAPASDAELRLVHEARYIEAVRRVREDPFSARMVGIGPGDNPPFEGMHEASAAVAGGSLAAMGRILDGSTEHAFHPGGGLHHAMAARAGGFCIYDDPALAIALARRAGQRVLYVDLDVHHGDGVQAIFWEDPEVMTVSLHESGHWLFPGTGFVEEVGEGRAAGTAANVPFEPGTGDADWLAALQRLVPALVVAHGPDVLVSQNGCDGHVFDPLAHLALTTRAMHRATRLLDRLAHRHCGGRWLATGGGGYEVHRVIPRSWALVWSAQAHLEPGEGMPEGLPPTWIERWAAEAERVSGTPLPDRLLDPEGLVPDAGRQNETNRRTLERAVRLLVPGILDRMGESPAGDGPTAWAAAEAGGDVTIAGPLTELPAGTALGAGVVAVARPTDAWAALGAALERGALATLALAGRAIVGLALVGPASRSPGAGSTARLLACGVSAPWRRRGLARALLGRALADEALASRAVIALVTPSERDPLDPEPWPARAGVAAALLERAGFAELRGPGWALGIDGTRAMAWFGPAMDRSAAGALTPPAP
jgi:acetoin utilization protein AcuC